MKTVCKKGNGTKVMSDPVPFAFEDNKNLIQQTPITKKIDESFYPSYVCIFIYHLNQRLHGEDKVVNASFIVGYIKTILRCK